MSKKYFGTDGIRGRVGISPITPDFVMRLGYAAGRVLANADSHIAKDGHPTVLIGKDTRISGYMLESALQAGLCAAGVNVRLTGPMPTPAVAYLTRALRAQAGIVISASHNPFEDNGIKFFSSLGTKLPDDIEHQIEAELDKPMEVMPSAALGRVKRIDDAAGRYVEFCKSTFPNDLDLRGLKIVVDCANGATYHVAPPVFHELGAEVISIANQPNGLNINADSGTTHPQALCKAVVDYQADLGIAFDGDGDRVMMVDSAGNLLDGDQLLYIIAKHRHEQGELGGGVVGHILCLDKHTSGDGIIASLQVLAALNAQNKTLKEVGTLLTLYPQVLINIPVKRRIDLDANPAVQEAVKKAEHTLNGNGRILLRSSGTELKFRVMVEGVDGSLVNQLAKEIAEVVSVQAT